MVPRGRDVENRHMYNLSPRASARRVERHSRRTAQGRSDSHDRQPEFVQGVAEQFDVPFHNVGDDRGNPDNTRMVELFDEYEVNYIVLARYMRIIPPSTCWRYAGGRIINLHHGILPSFPGFRPYEDAYSHNMLTFGATAHFIVPELDAGNQIINQECFTVFPGTSMEEVKRKGEEDNEPECLVEGLRRVVEGIVELHFHRVVRTDTSR